MGIMEALVRIAGIIILSFVAIYLIKKIVESIFELMKLWKKRR